MSFPATLRLETWQLGRWLIAIWISVSIIAVPFAHAEMLPVKTYTAADGLPRDSVWKVRQDARGFL